MTDLRTAHEEWLNHFENSSLSRALQAKHGQLRQALQAGDPARAWTIIASMHEICEQLHDPRQMAEMLLATGRAAFELGDYQRARMLLEESVAGYNGDRHPRAVARWMLGYVLWNISDQHENAIAAWNKSLDDFNWFYRQPFTRNGAWYQERFNEMQQALDESLDLDSLPPRLQPHVGLEEPLAAVDIEVGEQPAAPAPETGPAAPGPVDETPAPGLEPGEQPAVPIPETGPAAPVPEPEPGMPTPPPAHLPGRAPRIQPGFLEGFGVLGEGVITNPEGRPVGVDPHSDDEMLIEQVTIGEQAFGIFNPYRSGAALRLSNKDLRVVPVFGDSMNLAGIEEGDYALVRLQDTAQDGDIVIAQMGKEDTRGTLKRFKRERKDLVLLISESTQEYPAREFTPGDEDFTIRGKVMAIFKKQ